MHHQRQRMALAFRRTPGIRPCRYHSLDWERTAQMSFHTASHRHVQAIRGSVLYVVRKIHQGTKETNEPIRAKSVVETFARRYQRKPVSYSEKVHDSIRPMPS